MHDYYTGIPAGKNLVRQFKSISQVAQELRLKKPIIDLHDAQLTVSIEDHEGNIASIVHHQRRLFLGLVRFGLERQNLREDQGLD